MTSNTALAGRPVAKPAAPLPRSVVLVGLMGAGKTAIGRRLAARLGLPFRDSDSEIEAAAGRTVPELFSQFGEAYFRAGERRVIRRLLEGPPIVLATGGGAFMDPATRATVRQRGTSVWLRAPLPVLLRRVALRRNRPLLANGDPAAILSRLMAVRHPIYAEADIVVDCADDLPDQTTRRVASAIAAFKPPRRLPVRTGSAAYDVVVGDGLLHRAGALLAPVLPQKRVVVVTDTNVAPLHGQTLMDSLAATGFAATMLQVPPGEGSKSLARFGDLVDRLLDSGAERQTAVLALGGGVVGDLAGFAAAVALRGLPFVQLPTTLLAQVDSGVGGKTGINTARGKNLLGAFHQPRMVIADTGTLATLPPREKRAGYAEVVKAGLIGDAEFYDWCEQHGAAVVGDDTDAQAEAILRACAFKAQVVGDDEREERPNDGRALLNLGHTFGHAIEAECGYGAVLHGEAVAVGLGLAFRLSAALGHCDPAVADRVEAHVAAVGLPAELSMLNRRFSAAKLMGLMRRDKKMRDGQLHFVLARGIGEAFTASDVPPEAVEAVLRNAGCEA
ncbi:3-dehydroquinate synthase [Acidisphaera sp. L21]|uniref:3-dehydroquinate synthase n=1 Tax=Acidisphaera sp. L21 TaxID=1641851 RepID=UPI00131D15EC|nr:3-dehydroquinate synthase [Acidisphaera sp. L21]